MYLKYLYLLLFISFIVQGILVATGNIVLSTFSVANNTFLVAAWIGIAYINMTNNKTR